MLLNSLLVKIFIYRVEICYSQETRIDIEWYPFLDCYWLAMKQVSPKYYTGIFNLTI